MNLRQIEVFRAIMLTGSISGAARLLSVSQPAVSRLLAYTEDRLGLKLFARITGRLKATPEARRLFDEVDEVYQGVQRINDLAAALRTGSTGRLRVVGSPSLGESVLPAALALFRELHPAVQAEVHTLTLADLVRQVAINRADVGLTMLPVEHPNITVTVICEGRLMCVCRRDHPLAVCEKVAPGDLTGFPLIAYDRETPFGMIVWGYLDRAPQTLRPSVIVRFTPMACALVQAGAGVAITDEFVMTGRTWPDLVAKPLTPKVPLRIRQLVPRDAPMSRLARSFSTVLRSVLPFPDPSGEA
jgi:DNA-binding transcriptional LysR family regulator